MSLINFIYILTGVLLNAAAQLFLKGGTNSIGQISLSDGHYLQTLMRVAFEPFIVAGLACYVFSVAIWIVALSKVEVSVAYPMLSIGYVVNAIAAWYLFGEVISMQKLLSLFLIIAGVILMARS
ncbi:MAG: SMR family transporter [Pseudomonadota bacterium]